MHLTYDFIQSITRGACNIRQEADGFHFDRFTTRQRLAFRDMAADQYLFSESTAGIRLEFSTDSDYLEIDVSVPGKYELLIDGLPRYFFPQDQAGTFRYDLPMGMKRLTLVLPHHSPGVIKGICLQDGCTATPAEYQKRFLFLGDSITQGWSSARDCTCYAGMLARYYGADYMDLAVGGSWFNEATLEDVGFAPHVIFIAYGTNDYRKTSSLDAVISNCENYLKKVRDLYPQSKIIAISPIWRADAEAPLLTGTLSDVRRVLIDIYQKENIPHIDGYTLVPHMPEYFEDGYLHPNDLGFALYALNLTHALEGLL